MLTDYQKHVHQCWDEYTRVLYPSGPECDQLFAKIVPTERVESWQDFERWSRASGQWGFRGQREASWTLQSSLERSIKVEYSRANVAGHYHDREAGNMLLPKFMRSAKKHITDLPQDDPASCLAWMQDYEAPTRLLDWTYSAEIALYFALEKSRDAAAVWAVDLEWIESSREEMLAARSLDLFSDIGKIPLIVRVDPPYRNPRLDAQQGFFLWKLVEETPFFDQIFTGMILHPAIPELPVIRKLDIPIQLRSGFLEKLHQINVNRTTLFPPDDGYSLTLGDLCASLKQDIKIVVERQRHALSMSK